MIDKPISLKIQEFQKNISAVIGESELPIFMIKFLIKDLCSEIDNVANDFAQKEIAEYYQSLENEKKDEEQN